MTELKAPNSTRVIYPESELGMALLIAQAEDGAYEPIAVVSTINEAKKIAQGNFKRRLKDIEAGQARMCPERYALWARNQEGDYQVVSEIEPN